MAKATLSLPPRCAARGDFSLDPGCGRLAQYQRFERATGEVSFFCAQHSRASDQAIAKGTRVRRVRLSCSVVFTGVSTAAAAAEEEARARLELAIYSAFGTVDVTSVSSSDAYTSVAGAPPGRRGDGD
jgi:hypothetical protein